MAADIHSLLTTRENKQDITRNLPSLTFESALDDDERLLLHLRQQSHSHTAVFCATSAFLVNILNELRQIRSDLAKTSKQRRAIQLLTAEFLPKDPLHVGIIGCGRLGTHLVDSLLSFGDVKPSDLKISTRRPETLGRLKEKGVEVFYNNIELAKKSHIIFICVLPSHLQTVVEEIHEHLPPSTLVYCVCNHTKAKKLKFTLKTSSIIVPKFVFKEATSSDWNSCVSIHGALEDSSIINKCCPLSESGRDSCVHLTDKWVELIICAFVNHCTHLEMMADAALDMLHGIFFGLESIGNDDHNKFTERDFIINWDQDNHEPRKFPTFDLCKIHDNDSNVLKKLRESPTLQASFVNKFAAVFQAYHELKRYDEIIEKK